MYNFYRANQIEDERIQKVKIQQREKRLHDERNLKLKEYKKSYDKKIRNFVLDVCYYQYFAACFKSSHNQRSCSANKN